MDTDRPEPDEETVITPGGPRPRSTTHLVPPGSRVRQHADGSLTVEPIPAPGSDAAGTEAAPRYFGGPAATPNPVHPPDPADPADPVET